MQTTSHKSVWTSFCCGHKSFGFQCHDRYDHMSTFPPHLPHLPHRDLRMCHGAFLLYEKPDQRPCLRACGNSMLRGHCGVHPAFQSARRYVRPGARGHRRGMGMGSSDVKMSAFWPMKLALVAVGVGPYFRRRRCRVSAVCPPEQSCGPGGVSVAGGALGTLW